MFLEGEICTLNKHAIKGLPHRIGERCVIIENNYKSLNYDYMVEFDDGEVAPVKENELNKLTESDKSLMGHMFTGNTLIHISSGEKVKIIKVDYILGQAEVDFLSGGSTVVEFKTLKAIDKEIDSMEGTVKLTNTLIDTFLSQYRNADDTYTVPKIVLEKLIGSVFEEGE